MKLKDRKHAASAHKSRSCTCIRACRACSRLLVVSGMAQFLVHAGKQEDKYSRKVGCVSTVGFSCSNRAQSCESLSFIMATLTEQLSLVSGSSIDHYSLLNLDPEALDEQHFYAAFQVAIKEGYGRKQRFSRLLKCFFNNFGHDSIGTKPFYPNMGLRCRSGTVPPRACPEMPS